MGERITEISNGSIVYAKNVNRNLTVIHFPFPVLLGINLKASVGNVIFIRQITRYL